MLRRPIGVDVVRLTESGAVDSSKILACVRVDGRPILLVAGPVASRSADCDRATEERFWQEVRRLAQTQHRDGKAGLVDLVRHPPERSAGRRYEPEGEPVEQ